MFVQIIESRYTVDHDILKSHLKDLFGEGKFEIIPPDEGEKWKVRIPREMIRDELVDLQRKFRRALAAP